MSLSIPRLCAVLMATIALSWFLPNIFVRATRSEAYHMSGMFSPIKEEFVIWHSGADSLRFTAEDGAPLTTRAGRSQMPFTFSHDAAKWGLFPITINGETISYEEAKTMTRLQRLRPRLWTGEIIPLYTLFESRPETAELSLPPDVFRLTNTGIVFINCHDGSINEDKSGLFTRALYDAGVTFPIRAIGGNPNHLKTFDEGYFFTDADGLLYQLTMVAGQPRCRQTGIMVPGEIRHIAIEEHQSRVSYGLIVTDEGVFSIGYDDTLRQLPLRNYSATSHSISLMQMPHYYSITQQELRPEVSAPIHLIATDSDFEPVRTHDIALPEEIQQQRDTQNALASMLFPLTIRQFTPLWNGPLFLVQPAKDLKPHAFYAALGGVASLLLLLGIQRYTRRQGSLLEALLVFCTGIPGLLATLAFGPVKKK